jgi:Carboxypeptidase regulatory-like domain
MGAIVGNITTTGGEPIADASVMVESGPSHPDLAAITDESGVYRLGDLEPGQYVIRVFAEGFSTVSGRVPVRRGHTTRANLTLEEDETPVPEMDDQFEDEFQAPFRSSSGHTSDMPNAPPRPPRRRPKN